MVFTKVLHLWAARVAVRQGLVLHVGRGEELAWGALVSTEGRGYESRGVVWAEEVWEARGVGVVVVLEILWLSSSS